MNHEWLGFSKEDQTLFQDLYTDIRLIWKNHRKSSNLPFIFSKKMKRNVFNTTVKLSRVLRKCRTAGRPGRLPDKEHHFPGLDFLLTKALLKVRQSLANCARGRRHALPPTQVLLQLPGEGGEDRQEHARKYVCGSPLSAISALCTVSETTLYRWKVSQATVFLKKASDTRQKCHNGFPSTICFYQMNEE